MLQQEADLYRLATHVHRGQSASSRKCAYKWGSYFYFFCHFTRSLYNRSSIYTSVGFFFGTSSYFSLHYCLPTTFCWTLKQEKFLFRSFSPTQPGFQASVHPLGSFLPWFPHCRTHCPMDSSKPSVLCPTWLGQLPFYVTSFQHELHYFYEVKDTEGRCRSESWTIVILTTQKWPNISI